jgi:plastocyanin
MRSTALSGARAIFFLGASATAVCGGLVAPSAAEASEVRVDTAYMAFSPETIRVKVGDRITWVNHSGVMHEIFFPINPTDSDDARLRYTLTGNREISITVTKPGDFDYFCRWHGMQGHIHVAGQSAR